MPTRHPRPHPPGVFAQYASGEPLRANTAFIAILKTMDGMAVAGAWVNVRLDGGGFLRPDGAYDMQAFTFQRTDESGVIQFTWVPGTGAVVGPISLLASAATAGQLAIRRL